MPEKNYAALIRLRVVGIDSDQTCVPDMGIGIVFEVPKITQQAG